MLTVEGGFAKAVNVESTIEGNFVKSIVYMKMVYANEKARESLVKRLHEEGYTFSAGNHDDTRFKVFKYPLFTDVLEWVK